MPRWKRLIKSRFFLVSALLFAVSIVVFSFTSSEQIDEFQTKPCKIHKLDPWDKTLADFSQIMPPLNCSHGVPTLMFVDEEGYLQYDKSATSHFDVTSLQCVYRHVNRKSDDLSFKLGKPVSFNPPVFVNNRVFKVECSIDGKPVYQYVHSNVFYAQSEERAKEIGDESDDNYSIIYFGIDSASRSHALRKLPKSYNYLKELGAYDFKGYMKVGLNSFPNIVPLLTGTEHTKYVMENLLHFHVDNMPFIWKRPELHRYTTMHSEDRPDIATLNYLNSGFSKQPVDYYFREYSLAMDQIEPTVLKSLGRSTWWCYGNDDHFKIQIKYMKDFILKNSGKLKFGFLWNNQIGHESFLSLSRGDEPLLDFLKWMKERGQLKNTVFIVGSDHGFRLGGASTTFVGRLENNMPFLSIVLPESLTKRYPDIDKNMKINTDRLASPYDIYETMSDVANKRFKHLSTPPVLLKRTGRSFFGEIPEMRSCLDAGIPSQYCTCYDAVPISTQDPIVIQTTRHVTEHLNYRLKEYKHLCQQLLPANITESRVAYIAEGDGDNNPIDRNAGFFKQWWFGYDNAKSGRYIVMFYTKPNYGLIEAMVDFEEHPATGPEHKMTILGDPVRVNKYGNQSHCIEDRVLKQYCMCNDVKLDPKLTFS